MPGPLIMPFAGKHPKIHPSAFIAPNAVVIGDVEIGEGASIWFGVVLRGDDQPIRIGARSNIQDNSVVHITASLGGTVIGDDVLVGHLAIIHAATLESGSFVGMGAVVLDGAVVSSGAMLAAGAVLTPGKCVPKGELWAGNPARKMRDLRPEEIRGLGHGTAMYVDKGREFSEACAGLARNAAD